ncbi:MAG: DUF1883 domain-containing protein [Spirochaetales bacterium]|nr:DUF1883 domain-containing protein [Spirochaetales bacterium]
MNHLHTYLYLEKDGIIQVSLDSPGNVYLLKDAEYKKYLEGKEFQGYGGLIKARKKQIKAPGQGKWHLVIDNSNQQESLNVALNITNGRQIPEDEMPAPENSFKEETDKKTAFKDEQERKKFLIKEITGRLKDLDEENLHFLIQQARVLLHKQEVEKLNREIDHYNDSYVVGAEPESKKKKSSSSEKPLVDLKEQSKNTYILVLCGARKILSGLELREIVKMCHTQMSDSAFSSRLYEWLKVRRNDILFDARIRTADHPVWPILRRFLRNRFKAKS